MRVRVDGAPVTDKPVLILSNHVSWLDIPVIGSTMPLVFISKSEVRNWPLVGPAAQLMQTIFVDRSRRQKTAEVNARIASKMSGGDPVVLFAEGTSSDGNRVLQFRSALVGAASDAVTQNKGDVWLQPMSISYPRIDGLPMGRGHRPRVAWYGDMDFVPHLKDYVLHGGVDAVVTFGEPIAFDGGDRKSMVKSIESAVRRDADRGLARRLFAKSGLKSPAFLFAAKTAMKWPNGAEGPAWNHGMSEIYEPLKASGPFGAARLTAHRAA